MKRFKKKRRVVSVTMMMMMVREIEVEMMENRGGGIRVDYGRSGSRYKDTSQFYY